MRIAVVDALLYTPPYDKELCAALASLGHEVFFVGAASLGPAHDWKAANVEFIPIPVDSFWNSDGLAIFPHWAQKIIRRLRYALQIRRLDKVCQDLRPDVVHFQWSLFPMA